MKNKKVWTIHLVIWKLAKIVKSLPIFRWPGKLSRISCFSSSTDPVSTSFSEPEKIEFKIEIKQIKFLKSFSFQPRSKSFNLYPMKYFDNYIIWLDISLLALHFILMSGSSHIKCSNLHWISKLPSNFGCLFTFCYLDGTNSIITYGLASF